MNGDAMLVELRKTDWGKNIKVIILTNMGEQEVPENIKQLGVSAFILKADMTPRQVAELVKSRLTENATQLTIPQPAQQPLAKT